MYYSTEVDGQSPSWLRALYVGLLVAYSSLMNKNNNPYVQQLLEQGREPSRAPARKVRQFPCQIGARYFYTQEQYDQALADFLNSN